MLGGHIGQPDEKHEGDGMKRRAGFLLIFGAALSLAVASYAWACGNLATFVPSNPSAAPGGTVTAEGSNYSNTAAGGATDVVVHLNTRDGQVLWSGPAVNRRVSPSFSIPAGTALGYYTLIATQYQSDGVTPTSGTPGRARIQVTSSGAAEPAVADAAAPSDPAAGSSDAAAPVGAAPPAAAAAPAPTSRATAKKKKARKKARARKARGKQKAAVAPWSSSTPPSAPGRSEASSAGSLSASATLPGILVALVMLPTGLLLVRSREGQRADTA